MPLTEFQEGYIFTRHWRDSGAHTTVEFWLSTHAGPRLLRLRPQPSVAFIPASQQAEAGHVLKGETRVELRPLSLKDYRQRPVLGLYTQQYRPLVGLARRLAQSGVDVYEADIQPPDRYMMERFVTAPVLFRGESD